MKIFNSMSRQKEEFVPIQPGKVSIYACGPTVYNFIHVGNARPIILFDVLRRYFEYRGYDVTFVQNFTDVDDKIIKRANEEGITSQESGRKVHQGVLHRCHRVWASVPPPSTPRPRKICSRSSTWCRPSSTRATPIRWKMAMCTIAP